MSGAGNFNLEVYGPYPCWINIYYENQPLCRFNHKELSDLHYAVTKAMQEAKLLLGKDANEV